MLARYNVLCFYAHVLASCLLIVLFILKIICFCAGMTAIAKAVASSCHYSPGHVMWDSWWTKWHWSRFSMST
jgi:hypothetical protein